MDTDVALQVKSVPKKFQEMSVLSSIVNSLEAWAEL